MLGASAGPPVTALFPPEPETIDVAQLLTPKSLEWANTTPVSVALNSKSYMWNGTQWPGLRNNGPGPRPPASFGIGGPPRRVCPRAACPSRPAALSGDRGATSPFPTEANMSKSKVSNSTKIEAGTVSWWLIASFSFADQPSRPIYFPFIISHAALML